MKYPRLFLKILLMNILFTTNYVFAQNPLIMDQFSADPTARVFDGKVYVYPSHDILANESRGRIGWFCMEDYHVFSSENMSDWKDHGVILSQYMVPWVDSESYSMWAPDCINRNGKYFFYFPSMTKDTTSKFRMTIGVAISDYPYGPFVPQPDPIKNVRGIDPNVFIDNHGEAFLYWAARNIYAAKLKKNMIEIDGDPIILENLPLEGLKEGPFLFERNGIYYMTYPHVENNTERLEYAIANNPLGPFKVTGVIMDESPECWTNHQSIVEFKDQWYLFYHFNDLSPHFDKNRSVRADSLFFNEDGTIKKVIPSLRGVGLTDASKKIQIDRYTSKSNEGVLIEYLDTLNRFEGWKTIFKSADSWVQYNSVDFGTNEYKFINVRALSDEGGNLQLRLNNIGGPIIANVKISAGDNWNTIKAPLSALKPGVQNLILAVKDNKLVEVDWISFE